MDPNEMMLRALTGNPVLQIDPMAQQMHAAGPGGLGNVEDTVTALQGGGGARSGGVAEAPGASAASTEASVAANRAAAVAAAAGREPLPGLPQEPVASAGNYVPGPIGQLHDIAEQYSAQSGIPYTRPSLYQPVDVDRAAAIAKAYDEMPHAPNDPAVKASYDAMIRETVGQYNALKNAGYTFEPIPPGAPDPYAATPRLAAKDLVENGHLWYFPTQSGFGTINKINDNPLLNDSGERINGQPLLNNDVFRIVHDVFGHFKEGNGFRATGEDNAWRSHAGMYSDLARPAMTSETRGQNSWVNFGPHGEANRKASAADTVYANQKVGLLPSWVYEGGGNNYPPKQLNQRQQDKVETSDAPGASPDRGIYGYKSIFDKPGQNEPPPNFLSTPGRSQPSEWSPSRTIAQRTWRQETGRTPGGVGGRPRIYNLDEQGNISRTVQALKGKKR